MFFLLRFDFITEIRSKIETKNKLIPSPEIRKQIFFVMEFFKCTKVNGSHPTSNMLKMSQFYRRWTGDQCSHCISTFIIYSKFELKAHEILLPIKFYANLYLDRTGAIASDKHSSILCSFLFLRRNEYYGIIIINRCYSEWKLYELVVQAMSISSVQLKPNNGKDLGFLSDRFDTVLTPPCEPARLRMRHRLHNNLISSSYDVSKFHRIIISMEWIFRRIRDISVLFFFIVCCSIRLLVLFYFFAPLFVFLTNLVGRLIRQSNCPLECADETTIAFIHDVRAPAAAAQCATFSGWEWMTHTSVRVCKLQIMTWTRDDCDRLGLWLCETWNEKKEQIFRVYI